MLKQPEALTRLKASDSSARKSNLLQTYEEEYTMDVILAMQLNFD